MPEPAASENTPLDDALEFLGRAVAAWDPDRAPGVEDMLAGLRELQIHFDPRRARLSSTLCTSSMRLLEELRAQGSVGLEPAVEVVRQLFEQLRISLESAPSPVAATPFRTLPSSRPTLGSAGQPAAPSLSLKLADELRLGELMVRMAMLSQEDCDRVLRAQAESRNPRKRFGELCVELGFASQETIDSALRLQQRMRGGPQPALPQDSDPWGQRPL